MYVFFTGVVLAFIYKQVSWFTTYVEKLCTTTMDLAILEHSSKGFPVSVL